MKSPLSEYPTLRIDRIYRFGDVRAILRHRRQLRRRNVIIVVALMSALPAACSGSQPDAREDGTSATFTVPAGGTQDSAELERWVPKASDSWQWQLEGELNTTYDVDVYDIDLFDVPVDTILAIQSNGAHVICYFSAGSLELWRDDADDVNASAVGNTLDGWEDERWLDVTHPSVAAVMAARLDLAVEKRCDGVEPDNVNGYDDNTGFDFGRTEQIAYNRWLAEEAHRRGLAVGLKNSLELVADLVDDFDFAVNEECWDYDECTALGPFSAAGKAVFNAEYAAQFTDDPDAVCDPAVDAGLRTLILPRNLDDTFRISCDERQTTGRHSPAHRWSSTEWSPGNLILVYRIDAER